MKLGAVLLGATVTVLALAAVGALYALGGSGGAEAQYRTTLALLRDVEQLSSKWSIETARVKSDPLADFDSLGFFVPRMNRLKQNLAASVRQIPDLPERLAGDLAAYSNTVAAKEERIERFKAEYAVVRASTNYFPLAATNLVQQAEAADVGGLARAVSAIASDMSTYLMQPSDAGRSRLGARLQALRAASGRYPLPVANAVMDFLSHGEVLLDRKEPAEALFREATSNDLSEATNRIAARLEAELNRREVAAAYYQRAMAAVVGALAVFWLVLLWRQRSRGGPPAFDEAFQSPAEPAPTPEAAVDSALRFESPPEAPTMADPPDPVLALGADAPAGEEEKAEGEEKEGKEEEAFVPDEPPAVAAAADADAAVGEVEPGEREEERPAGKDDALAGGEAPAFADSGEEAVFTEDDAPFGEDEPPARPEDSSAASVPPDDELQSIRDLLLRINDPAPAAAEGGPPVDGEVATAGEEAPVGGEAGEAPLADEEEALPSGFGTLAAPAAPAGEEWPPVEGEIVTVGEEVPADGEAEEAPLAEGEEALPAGSGTLAAPVGPVGDVWPPVGGEVVTVGEEAPGGGEAEESPLVDEEEALPAASEPLTGPSGPVGDVWPPVGGEVVTVGEEAPDDGEAEEASLADEEEVLPSGSGTLAAPAAPVGDVWPPVGGEVVTVGEEAPADEEAPVAEGEEAPLPAPEGGLASTMRPASRAESLPETRRRLREALGAGAAIVDLRAGGAGPDAGPGAASGAAPDVRRDVRRIEDLLEGITPSPPLPGGGPDGGRVDVNACIDEAIRATGAESAAAVERDLRPVPEVSGSKAGVRLLLAEVIENAALAVEARPERPPSLRVHTSRRNDEVLVTIVDNGVGIPEEAREAVFHPFHTSRDGALGVGLALARCLAEKQGGAVTLNSLPPHGTVARITLPIERPGP